MLHNYCHWLGPAVKENEFLFSSHRSMAFFRSMTSGDWYWIPINLISFLGHYGVPVFLFLSAYGLVMKYESVESSSKSEPSALQFIRKHYSKLFLMMIFGYAMFLFVDFITPRSHHYRAIDIPAQLLMLNNLLPNPDKIIWPGPYWFFGLMLQLYVIYRLLLYRRSSWWGIAVVALCFVLQLMCHPESDTLNRLRYNSIGAMLPFVAGMIYARLCQHGRYGLLSQEKLLLPASLTLVGVALLALCCILAGSSDFASWLWAPLAVCILWVAVVRLLPQYAISALAWLGNISAAIFVLHPILRKVFIPISRRGDVYAGLIIYVMVTIVAAYAYTAWRRKEAKA